MAKLSSTQILAMYNATHKTKVSADASLYQLGAVLQQKQASGEFRPIAYISCALSETEQHLCTNREGSIGRDLGS